MHRSTTLTDLAPELLHQIFDCLHSISDVLSLASTCHHLHSLLPSTTRLPTLFLAAEREFGPLEDIGQLLTYNDSQPAHIKRTPQQSYSLLRQMLNVGRVANRIAELYPPRRWGDERYLERRALIAEESWKVRRAVYRYWLYCTAFQGRTFTRSCRMVPSVIEERATLLRTWTTEELIEIEELRIVLEDVVSNDICPTDGAATRYLNEHYDFRDVRHKQYSVHPFYQQRSWNSWPPDHSAPHLLPPSLFYSFRDDQLLSSRTKDNLPVAQRRKLAMIGWGDEISQYYVVQSMMKLNPRQIVYLHDNAVTKADVEKYIFEQCDGGEWFWDNGQTWLDTWSLVLYKRGEDLSLVRGAIQDGEIGITGTESLEAVEARS